MSSSSTPMNSKKFLAYMVADISWTGLIAAGLFLLKVLLNSSGGVAIATGVGIVPLLMTLVVVKGFLQVAYLTNQAILDRYTHLAETTLKENSQRPRGP